MAQFKLELANREDDADLRRILRENPMDGAISLTLRKEPSFFEDLSVEGNFSQVVVAREDESKKVVGFGVRSTKPLFINGEIKEIGYLGGLRLDKKFRGTMLVPRGYKLFSELHKDGRTPFYLTTIIEDNEYAKKILTSNRMGMPQYNDFGLYNTFIIQASNKNSRVNSKVIQADESHIEDIVKFVNDEGRKKQFYPAYSLADLTNPNGLLRGLKIEDILLHFNGAKIDGVLASWDQTSFRQTVVEKYSGLIRYAKPVINCVNQIRGIKPYLPKEGEMIDYSSAALIAVEGNNKRIFEDLLISATCKLAEHEKPLLMVGLHSDDGLTEIAKQNSIVKFQARLYLVTWPDGKEEFQKLDKRTPYLELGSL